MPLRPRVADHHRPYIDLLDRVAVFASEEPLVYRRIRARLEEIRTWFSDRTGWVVFSNRELIHLVREPAQPSAGHGFAWAQEPRDYELLTWTLWYGEESSAEQFLLSQLVQEIENRANERLGPGHVNWDDYPTRLSLARVLKNLELMGVLRRVHGQTDEWVASRQGDTLYEFTVLADHVTVLPAALAFVREAGRGTPRTLSPLPGLSDARQRLYRTLLLQAALYRHADPEAYNLISRPERREGIARDLRDTFGWDLEVTPSYAALLRPSSSAAAEPGLFPIRGALGQVVLLLAAEVRRRIEAGLLQADPYDRVRLSLGELVTLIGYLREEHRGRWGVTLGQKGPDTLAGEVLRALREWDMLSGPDEDGQVYLEPLLGRFTGEYREDDPE